MAKMLQDWEAGGRRRRDVTALPIKGEPENPELQAFSYVKDDGAPTENVTLAPEIIAAVNDLRCGRGIFELKKFTQDIHAKQRAAQDFIVDCGEKIVFRPGD